MPLVTQKKKKKKKITKPQKKKKKKKKKKKQGKGTAWPGLKGHKLKKALAGIKTHHPKTPLKGALF